MESRIVLNPTAPVLPLNTLQPSNNTLVNGEGQRIETSVVVQQNGLPMLHTPFTQDAIYYTTNDEVLEYRHKNQQLQLLVADLMAQKKQLQLEALQSKTGDQTLDPRIDILQKKIDYLDNKRYCNLVNNEELDLFNDRVRATVRAMTNVPFDQLDLNDFDARVSPAAITEKQLTKQYLKHVLMNYMAATMWYENVFPIYVAPLISNGLFDIKVAPRVHAVSFWLDTNRELKRVFPNELDRNMGMYYTVTEKLQDPSLVGLFAEVDPNHLLKSNQYRTIPCYTTGTQQDLIQKLSGAIAAFVNDLEDVEATVQGNDDTSYYERTKNWIAGLWKSGTTALSNTGQFVMGKIRGFDVNDHFYILVESYARDTLSNYSRNMKAYRFQDNNIVEVQLPLRANAYFQTLFQ